MLVFHLLVRQGQAATEVALIGSPAGIKSGLHSGHGDGADTAVGETGTANLAADVLNLSDAPQFGKHFPRRVGGNGHAVDFRQVPLEVAHIYLRHLSIAHGDLMIDILRNGAENTAEHGNRVLHMVVIFKAAVNGGEGILAHADSITVGGVGSRVKDFFAREFNDPTGISAQHTDFCYQIDGGLPQAVEHFVVTGDHVIRVILDAPLFGDLLQLRPVDPLVKVGFKANGTGNSSRPEVGKFSTGAYTHRDFLHRQCVFRLYSNPPKPLTSRGSSRVPPLPRRPWRSRRRRSARPTAESRDRRPR